MRSFRRICAGLLVSMAAVTSMGRYDRAMLAQEKSPPRQPSATALLVDDFEVNGTGDHASWQKASWVPLRRRQPDGAPYDTRFKSVYSTTGIYFLIDGTDRKLTAT